MACDIHIIRHMLHSKISMYWVCKHSIVIAMLNREDICRLTCHCAWNFYPMIQRKTNKKNIYNRICENLTTNQLTLAKRKRNEEKKTVFIRIFPHFETQLKFKLIVRVCCVLYIYIFIDRMEKCIENYKMD